VTGFHKPKCVYLKGKLSSVLAIAFELKSFKCQKRAKWWDVLETSRESNFMITDTKLISSFPRDSRIVARQNRNNSQTSRFRKWETQICSPCTSWRQAGGSKFIAALFLSLCTRWSWAVNITPPADLPPGNNSVTYWIGNWVCCRADLEVFGVNKYL